MDRLAQACVVSEKRIGEGGDEPAAGYQSAGHVPRCGTNGHELHRQATHSGFNKREDRSLLSQMRQRLQARPLSQVFRKRGLSAPGAL
jgi:hypothetical protein